MRIPTVRDLVALLSDPMRRNAVYLILNTLGTSGLGLAFWLLVSRFYSTVDVGMASTLISTSTLIALVSLLGFDIALIRYLPGSDPKDAGKRINSCFTISALTSLALTSLFLATVGYWAPSLEFIRTEFLYTVLFYMSNLSWVFLVLLASIYVSKRKSKYVFIQNTWMNSVIKLFLAVVLVSLGTFAIYASWAFAVIITIIISSAILLRRLYRGWSPRPMIDGPKVRGMIGFSLWNYLGNLFYMASYLLLPLIITISLSASHTAYYYIAWTITGLLLMIPMAISTSLLAEGSHDEKKLRRHMREAVVFSSAILVPAVIFVYLFGDRLLMLMGQEYSSNAFEILRYFALGSLPYSLTTIFIAGQRVKKRSRSVAVIYGGMFFSTIGMVYLFMLQKGLLGVGMGWIVGQSLVLMMVAVIYGTSDQ